MTEFPLVLYFPDSETRELAIIAIQWRRPDMKIVAVSKDWERFWMPEGAGSKRPCCANEGAVFCSARGAPRPATAGAPVLVRPRRSTRKQRELHT